MENIVSQHGREAHSCNRQLGVRQQKSTEATLGKPLDFFMRLRRWAGEYTGVYSEDDTRSDELKPFQYELIKLAQEAIKTPEILDDNILEWLNGDQAKCGYYFINKLGEYDKDMLWFSKLADRIHDRASAGTLASYVYGLKDQDPDKIDQNLKAYMLKSDKHDLAILEATCFLPVTEDRVNRVIALIEDGGISQLEAELIIASKRWFEDIDEDDFYRLLNAIAGPDKEHAAEAVDLVDRWLNLGKAVTDDIDKFCWECLKTAQVNQRGEHGLDSFASKLASRNPERGYELLGELLGPEDVNRWDPLNAYPESKFWKVLYETDGRRALLTILNAAPDSVYFTTAALMGFDGKLDMVRDKDVILELAKEKEEWALLLSGCFVRTQPGFWDVVIPFAEEFLDNREVLGNLEMCIEEMGQAHVGLYHYLRECQADITQIIETRSLPAKIELWLKKIHSHCSHMIKDYKKWEEDRYSNL